ncbi:MAG: electron transport complex subunit RsxC [Saccharofermentanales bacterium]
MFQSVKSGRGIHPPQNKNTKDSPVLKFDDFTRVQIPLSMHIGKPCTSLVAVGDEVFSGQKIGDSDAYMSVPVHSSVSGKVKTIRNIIGGAGAAVYVIEIESDSRHAYHPDIAPPAVSDKETFIKAIRESGLVGLGGASFPTHVKMSPPKGKEPDILVVNAAECEPYITSDYRNCMEHPDGIIDGIASVMKWLSIPAAVIGIEDNKKPAADLLQKHIDKLGKKDAISIKVLKTIYPQGAEKPLIFQTIGRVVPSGGLPFDVKTLVLNVSTVLFISDYLKTGIPLIRKVLTLDGGALVNPCNVDVPIGAYISDIVEAAGGFIETASGFKQEPSKVIMGGPMMGVSIDRLDLGIIKANNAILALDSKQAAIPEEIPCIRCSRCVDACPMLLVPTTLDAFSRIGDLDVLKRYNLSDCIECGCCTYVCPSKRYLVQGIRSGKAKVLSAAKKPEVKA